MPPPRTEFSRRALRWLVPAAGLALVPKCVVCFVSYASLGAAMGIGGLELCGATAGSAGTWASALAWLGGAGGMGAIGLWAFSRPRF